MQESCRIPRLYAKQQENFLFQNRFLPVVAHSYYIIWRITGLVIKSVKAF